MACRARVENRQGLERGRATTGNSPACSWSVALAPLCGRCWWGETTDPGNPGADELHESQPVWREPHPWCIQRGTGQWDACDRGCAQGHLYEPCMPLNCEHGVDNPRGHLARRAHIAVRFNFLIDE